MMIIYTATGAIALAVVAGGLWGIVLAIEHMVRSMGVDLFQYVLVSPLLIFVSYLVGAALKAERKRHRRA